MRYVFLSLLLIISSGCIHIKRWKPDSGVQLVFRESIVKYMERYEKDYEMISKMKYEGIGCDFGKCDSDLTVIEFYSHEKDEYLFLEIKCEYGTCHFKERKVK